MDVDLTEINPESVEPNLMEEMERQTGEMIEHIKEVEDAPVRIADALGFKAVRGVDQRSIARFMARIEAETGKSGADAFVTFTENYINGN